MTHFWSGLVSWMNRGSGAYTDRRRAEFEIWAKTEYGKDWRHAYNYYMASGHMPKEEVRGFKNV